MSVHRAPAVWSALRIIGLGALVVIGGSLAAYLAVVGITSLIFGLFGS